MASDDESDPMSERETQFVYQSGDEEVLWAVQEITAERGGRYKVKWAGVDPSTGKPWAQSWVMKHDCTDDLVAEWKRKKKKKNKFTGDKKRGRRTSTTSRTSGASKRTGSAVVAAVAATMTAKTRRSTSKGTSSRAEPVAQAAVSPPSPPSPLAPLSPKQTAKRKRQAEVPVAATDAATTSTGVRQDQVGESSRPRKKQKTFVEVLLPPISSDEGGEDGAVALPRTQAKDASQNEMLKKKKKKGKEKEKEKEIEGDRSDGEESLPPKGKPKSERRKDAARSQVAVSSSRSDVREEPGLSRPNTKAKAVLPRRKERVADAVILPIESEEDDEELRPPKPPKKLVLKDTSLSMQVNDLPEKETELPVVPIKVGPPRGIKRKEKKKPGVRSKPGSSQFKPQSAGERVPVNGSPGRAYQGVSFFGTPLQTSPLRPFFGSPLQNKVDNPTTPSQRISTLNTSPSKRLGSPVLSPGTRARLELFDRMMVEPDVAPAPDVSEQAPDGPHFNFDDVHDDNPFQILDLPPPRSSPPRPDPKGSKLKTPNGLIVPETESSGNSQSQSQSQSLLPPPPPPQTSPARDPFPRKPMDLPDIAVITASATSSSASPQGSILPRKPPPPTNHSSNKRPLRAAYGFGIHARRRVANSDPPPSSIESFTTPIRVDKGKQKAIEDDQVQSGTSEGERDGENRKQRTRRKITDSGLRKRGKELFDQAQLAREAERQKIKKPKRLKTVNEIVNGTAAPPPEGSPLAVPSGAENILELRLEDVVDLNGGGNSATLDTQERSEAKPVSEENRERLRIELRQEEEESTQEAMGICSPPPVNEPRAMPSDDAQMPPPRSPKSPSLGGQIEVDHMEQPSTDLVLASVIVQASQEQRHEDMDVELSLPNQAASSPARPIPENLTDSPKRRLGEALSLLNVKSEEIQRLERELADERQNIQGLKTELSRLRESSEPTGPVRAAWDAERAQWTQERTKWETDSSLWETQRKEMSEERLTLTARLAELSDAAARAEEAKMKISELEAERAAWTNERDVMRNEMAQRLEELAALAKVRGEYDEDRSRWEAEKTLWAEEKARWETERAALQENQGTLSRSVDALTTSTESLRASKESVSKDRDFFREQYQQASTFVGSVRDENTELEKRVKIAEGQAQEGVVAIKALFEDRVKALQADVDRWKGLTELLQEKDRRTNDELRLRAAQTPDLAELCGRLNAENKSLEAEVRKLGQAQQRSVRQRNRLFYEILLLKKERASLRSKLSKRAKAPDNSTTIEEPSLSAPVPPTIEDLDDIDPNDVEILPSPDTTLDEPVLFPCMWRPQWRDQCQQLFDTKEDVERHMQEHYRDLAAE